MGLTPHARDRLNAELAELLSDEDDDQPTRQGAGGDAADLADNVQAVNRVTSRRKRIAVLRTLLDADHDPEERAPLDAVVVGCVVTLRYVGDDDPERYWVGEADTRPEDVTVVTPASPMGQALLGATPGDVVSYAAPGGVLEVELLDLE